MIPALLALLAVTFAAAAIGAAGSVAAPDFYGALAQPSWAPPPSVFGPVWTVLYLMMAVATWIVIRRLGWPGARPLVLLYLLQLAVNALWSWLFFRWQLGAVAFVEIVLLWLLVAVLLQRYWRASRVAGVMLVPYLAWVTFAGVLCYTLWQRNPALLS